MKEERQSGCELDINQKIYLLRVDDQHILFDFLAGIIIFGSLDFMK